MPFWPFKKEPEPEAVPVAPQPVVVDPEALLHQEKAAFVERLRKFDQNLAEHKTRLDDLDKAYHDLLIEHSELAASIPSLMAANSVGSAQKKALRLTAVKAEVPIAKRTFKEAKETYDKLVSARNSTKAKAEERLAALEKSILELKAAKALAEMNSMANDMASGLGVTDLSSLERMVEEAKIAARAKARIERDSFSH